MKQKYAGLFILTLLLNIFSVHAAWAASDIRWQGTFEATPQNSFWEYRVVALSPTQAIADESFQDELNQLGAEGWELEQVVTTQTGGYYIMKRIRSK